MAPAANLPKIIDQVAAATHATRNNWTPTPDGANTGGEALRKGMAFTAFLSGKRYYEICFSDTQHYVLRYRDGASGEWVSDPHLGTIGRDAVFVQAKAFILSSWWSGATDAAKDDTFRFSADPSTDIVEVPVLFYDKNGKGAAAYTGDCVNALVNGASIIVPKPYGPAINGKDVSGPTPTRRSPSAGLLTVRITSASWMHVGTTTRAGAFTVPRTSSAGCPRCRGGNNKELGRCQVIQDVSWLGVWRGPWSWPRFIALPSLRMPTPPSQTQSGNGGSKNRLGRSRV